MRPLLLAVALALVAAPVAAHQPSDAFLTLDGEENAIRGQWDIALRDLDHALGLDRDQDGRLVWGEVRARQEEIAAYALARLDLATDAGTCEPTFQRLMVDRHVGDAYAVLALTAACPPAPEWLEVRYRLLFDLDPSHRGLLGVTWNGETSSAVLAPDGDSWRVGEGGPGPLDILARFVPEGVRHVLIGIDHVLFLIALLLPALARMSRGPVRPVAREVLGIVSAFTAAHSITLALAALRIVVLPGALVESVIALSVVLAALNNLVPLIRHRIWQMAFAFGLVHGFGFAGVLAELGLPDGAPVVALLGFNLGVELGQLIVVAACLPFAWAIRRLDLRPILLVRIGSGAVAFAGLVWLVERALPLSPIDGLMPLARAL